MQYTAKIAFRKKEYILVVLIFKFWNTFVEKGLIGMGIEHK